MTNDGVEDAFMDDDDTAGTLEAIVNAAAGSTGILTPTRPEFPTGDHLS